MAYGDFKIRPDVQSDGALVFREGAPWAIVWWVIMAVPCCFVLFMLYDTKAWQMLSNPGMAAIAAATFALSLTTVYRLVRVLTRRKTLRIDPRTRTAAIVETWPHHFDVTCDLERVSIRVRPLTVTGYRLSWSGHCLIVQVGDAWFVIGADRVAPEGAAACLPQELRAIGMSPVIDNYSAIETKAAKQSPRGAAEPLSDQRREVVHALPQTISAGTEVPYGSPEMIYPALETISGEGFAISGGRFAISGEGFGENLAGFIVSGSSGAVRTTNSVVGRVA